MNGVIAAKYWLLCSTTVLNLLAGTPKAKHYFNSLGIHESDQVLYYLGIKEREHEVYFLNKIKNSKVLPYFEKIFSWGKNKSANNVDLEKKYRVEESGVYCKK